MKRERWEALTPEQQETFAPLCPDFVAVFSGVSEAQPLALGFVRKQQHVELRSPSDSLEKVRKKMKEYMENGACLG